MDARQTRMAQNETLFREVNERVNDLAAGHGVTDTTYGTSVSARTLTARSLHRHQTQEVPLTLA